VVWNGVITFLITFFLGWRLIERYKINPKLWLSDYLMIVAWVCYLAWARYLLVLYVAKGFSDPRNRGQYMRHSRSLLWLREDGRRSLSHDRTKKRRPPLHVFVVNALRILDVYCKPEHLRFPHDSQLLEGLPVCVMDVRGHYSDLPWHLRYNQRLRRLLAHCCTLGSECEGKVLASR
jgi:hypothetical protein